MIVSGREVVLGETVIVDAARGPDETVDDVLGQGRGRGRGRGGARDEVEATEEGLRGRLGMNLYEVGLSNQTSTCEWA